MTRELFWLALTTVMTGLLWLPYILDRNGVRGLAATMANPSPTDKPHSPWATRLLFAHMITVENLVVFAILVLILNDMNLSTATTTLACAVFFWSRLAYVIIYACGIPVLRTLAFAIGFLAQAVLALVIFNLL
jgi:uncharacterized MAPEG superfamily protein